jgi:hypothetical protein
VIREEVGERLKLLGASLDESSRRSLEELDAARRELAGRLEKLSGEVGALYESVKEVAALLEEAKLELISLLSTLGHSVDSVREAVDMKLAEVV